MRDVALHQVDGPEPDGGARTWRLDRSSRGFAVYEGRYQQVTPSRYPVLVVPHQPTR